MSVIESPETETYKCDYCGSLFRHHQVFDDHVIKCPSCGASSVKIVDEVRIKQYSDGSTEYQEKITCSVLPSHTIVAISVELILFTTIGFVGLQLILPLKAVRFGLVVSSILPLEIGILLAIGVFHHVLGSLGDYDDDQA